jgi:hypothetical protein
MLGLAALLALVTFAFSDANGTTNLDSNAPSSPPDDLPLSFPRDDYPYDESFNDTGLDYDGEYGDYNVSDRYYDDEYDRDPPPTVDPEVRKQPCPGPHSHRDRWGYCTCDDEYWQGNPDTAEGCWKCNDTCLMDATCVYPGKCQCTRRYRGDGVRACDMILPRVLGVSPSIGWSDDATIVNVTYVWDVNESAFEHAHAFCRFGGQTFPAELVTDDVVVCKTASRPAQTVGVAISFDGTHWSIEQFEFVYRNRFGLLNIMPIVLLYGLIVVGIAALIWHVFGAGRREEGNEDENQPFLGRGTLGTGIARKKTRPRKRIEA